MYREKLDLPNGFDEKTVKEWYSQFQRVNSGVVRSTVCALLEEIADLKGITLHTSKRGRKND